MTEEAQNTESENTEAANTVLGGEQEDANQEAGQQAAEDKANTEQQEADKKADSDKAGDDKGGEDPGSDAPFTPESLKLPEGWTLDSEMLEGFKPLAEELELSQDKAQSLIDMHVQSMQKAADTVTEQFETKQQETRDTWMKAVNTDPELSKPENQKLAASVLGRFGADKELYTALNETGMGNHPGLLRVLVKVGGMLSEDNPLTPSAGGGQSKPIEERMYPNHKQ